MSGVRVLPSLPKEKGMEKKIFLTECRKNGKFCWGERIEANSFWEAEIIAIQTRPDLKVLGELIEEGEFEL